MPIPTLPLEYEISPLFSVHKLDTISLIVANWISDPAKPAFQTSEPSSQIKEAFVSVPLSILIPESSVGVPVTSELSIIVLYLN